MMKKARKVLVAPDKFKGTLTAAEAAGAIEAGLREVVPLLEVRKFPIADGGEGTREAVRSALGGELVELPSVDALGRGVEVPVARAGGAAVFEMADAAGLRLVELPLRNPWKLTTRGVGMVLRELMEMGERRIFLGIGGSATNDAGLGMAAELGFRFLDGRGEELPVLPEFFERIERVEAPVERMRELMETVELTVLCDVNNPLLGEKGAAMVYGSQKGLKDPAKLDAVLSRVADVVKRSLGVDFRGVAGAGAAGGLGYGLMTFCGARLAPGFETIAGLTGVLEAVKWADLVITGEGRLDAQTLFGKGPAELARLAKEAGKPVVAFGGCVEEGAREGLEKVFEEIYILEGEGADGVGAGKALKRAARRFAGESPLFGL